ncbi:uncharacterized protein GGS22DRAFT_186395 [Annulohypoxylon maeteangense]|uniref:uncharacterized protein n=1 Tax=Annulohypoxylon maeteangense TaxID=1927788 RepID=UPI002007870C|nr:uncharacterized protein GGS22DRAFT_186395 [Annulohypoxylon maeteangense]KAI0887561.1 hypothetical protein GGS22DRAFT_186395 [Annulohypoxylon maeteangense]
MVPLSTLPVELIRKIGINLDSPSQLLIFSTLCKHFHSALTVTELATVDAKRLAALRKFDRSKPLSIFRGIGNEKPPVDAYEPILLWAIETGKDFQNIKRYIDIYQKNFPTLLQDYWLFNSDRPSYGIFVAKRFRPAIVVATRAGRLDVLRELIGRDCGREAEAGKRVSMDDAFKFACRKGLLDIASCLVANGLLSTERNLLTAAEHGHCELLSSVMLLPSLNDEEGRKNGAYILWKALYSYDIFNKEIILRIIKAQTYDFERGPRLRRAVIASFGPKRYIFRRRLTSLKIICLLEVWEKLTSLPIEAGDILQEAAKHVECLNVIKFILCRNTCTIGTGEERSQTMDRALSAAIRAGCGGIMRYLVQQGGKYSTFHLYEAILSAHLDAIREITRSGISVNCTFDFERELLLSGPQEYWQYTQGPTATFFETPLKLALHILRGGRSFLAAFELIHLGADFTNLTQEEKDWVAVRLYCHHFPMYFIKKSRYNDERNLVTNPSRLNFAGVRRLKHYKKFSACADNLKMVHAMAQLVIGDDYREKILASDYPYDEPHLKPKGYAFVHHDLDSIMEPDSIHDHGEVYPWDVGRDAWDDDIDAWDGDIYLD